MSAWSRWARLQPAEEEAAPLEQRLMMARDVTGAGCEVGTADRAWADPAGMTVRLNYSRRPSVSVGGGTV